MHYSDTELAEMVNEWSLDKSHIMYWFYRDIILQAEERGLVKVVANTEDKPFWWRSFEESIELSDRIKELIEKIKQWDNKRNANG
jgi:hypothetical protein